MKGFEVLTVKATVKDGDFTYNLMSNGKVHINNHKTNKSSTIGNCPQLALLLSYHFVK